MGVIKITFKVDGMEPLSRVMKIKHF